MQYNQPFDIIAGSYDEDFSFTITGRAQRDIVHNFLAEHINKGCSVLEINCGTGEDAFFLSAYGCQVLATDASEKMISQCLIKQRDYSDSTNPEFRVLNINELSVLCDGKKWDMIFSDFSGLNCLDDQEIRKLPAIFHSLLQPGGKLVFVLFGKKCLWEKMYLLLKRRFSEVNRRRSSDNVILSDGKVLKVYYYSPGEMKKIFTDYFEFLTTRPVGFFLPPSYLDPFFRNHRFIFHILKILERWSGRCSFLSDFSDHYIIECKIR